MRLGACPYVFIGPPARMREQLAERAERLRLRHLIIGAAMGYEEIERFRKEVVSSA